MTTPKPAPTDAAGLHQLISAHFQDSALQLQRCREMIEQAKLTDQDVADKFANLTALFQSMHEQYELWKCTPDAPNKKAGPSRI